MKTSLLLSRAANLLSLGALVVFAGCTNAPLRQSTSTLESEYDPSAYQLGSPGFVAPSPLQTAAPEYPWELKRWGHVGQVSVDFIIDETGRVADAQVATSTNSGFDESTLTALKKWTFKPGSQNGVAVRTRANIPIRFELED